MGPRWFRRPHTGYGRNGVHLIKTATPERWRDIVAGYQIISDNRAAIAQCERSEAKTASKIRCAIEIRSPNSM